MLSVNSVRAFGSSVASAGFSWLALPAAILTAGLEYDMNKKREHYFKEEFEKQVRVWRQKITETQGAFLKSMQLLKGLKSANNCSIKELASKVDDAQKEYCGALADYNFLTKGE